MGISTRSGSTRIKEYAVGALILGIGAFIFAFSALGQEGSISFPISELGNCASKDECRTYCDDPGNREQCLNFAVEHGLMSASDAERAREFVNETGPGGCRGEECKDYCEDPAHRDECLDFAVSKGFISSDEAQRIKKFPTSGPGGCRGEECRDYCDNPDNAEECLSFATDHDLIPAEGAERARRMLKAMREGGPGGCRSGNECREYCENPANEEQCLAFAEQKGLIPPEDLERAKKGREILQKIETEGGPGGCKGEEACKLYCADPTHTEECVNFAVSHGFMRSDKAREQLERFQRGDFDEYRERFEQHRERFEEEFRAKREEFEQRFRERREEFEQKRSEFEQRFRSGEFPTPNEFPGSSGEFPGRSEFPPPQEFPGQTEFQGQPSFPGQTQFPGLSPEEMRRYEEQFRQQYQSQYPDQGSYPPPSDQQQYQQYQEPPPPTSSLIQNLPAFILNLFRFR